VKKSLSGSNHQESRRADSRQRIRRTCQCGLLLSMVLVWGGLFAQTGAPVSADDTVKADEDSSKRVDESEESYRTRMELRDQRYREQKRADMIYSNQGGTSKLDRLPEASREHIKKQMREMIIASRQWKPGEDVSDYPYEPSQAAQTDAQLRSQEREAWAEQLQKYQQREAAAYAGGQDASEGGQENSGDGAKDSTTTNSGAAGQNRKTPANNAAYQEMREQEAEDISTDGVSESALSFLQGQSGQSGEQAQRADNSKQSETQDPGATGRDSDEDVPPGSVAVSDLARLQGMGTSPGESSESSSTQPPAGSSMTSAMQQSSDTAQQDGSANQDDQATALADTLLINELQKLNSAPPGTMPIADPGSVPADAENSAASEDVQPGTLEIAELKRLEGN